MRDKIEEVVTPRKRFNHHSALRLFADRFSDKIRIYSESIERCISYTILHLYNILKTIVLRML